MQNLLQKLKANWKVIFVVGMILLFVIGIILRLITPAIVPTVTSIPSTKTQTLKETSFTGATITFPTALPTVASSLSVYQVVNTPVSLNTLATELGLQTLDQGEHWYSDSGASMSQDPYSKRIGYSSGLGEAAESTASDSAKPAQVDKDKAATTASTFIQQVLKITTLSPDIANIKLRQSGYEDNYSNVGQEDIAEIPFQYNMGGQPVYTDIDLFAPISIQVNSAGQVLSFSMSPNIISNTTQEVKVKTATLEQIKSQILNNNVGILQISSETPDGFTIKNLKSLEISSMIVEYRLNSQTRQVLPYYRISGTATNLQGSISQLQLITPVIVTTP